MSALCFGGLPGTSRAPLIMAALLGSRVAFAPVRVEPRPAARLRPCIRGPGIVRASLQHLTDSTMKAAPILLPDGAAPGEEDLR